MSESREVLSDFDVGERLRIARELAKITQAKAAEAINAARTTVIAIEQGQRRIRMDEIQKLAALFGTSVNAILRREAVHLDMVPRFRKLQQVADSAAEEAALLLNDLVRAEVELENALGVQRSRNYPPERPLLPGDVKTQAEQDAQDLRDWLGLGAGPAFDILSILELQLGIRVYLRKLASNISSLFAYDEAAGACILLNASHPMVRIKQSALHELAHFVSARRQPEVLVDDEKFLSREERYAKYFAPSFLTPARAVRQRFVEITSGQSHLTRRHVILLAHAFGVAREAMVRRLEDLGLARQGTWDWFERNGGITAGDVESVTGRKPDDNAGMAALPGGVPYRIALLAREAWKRDLYSEGQLARLLKMDRLEIREVLDGAANEEAEASEFIKLAN